MSTRVNEWTSVRARKALGQRAVAPVLPVRDPVRSPDPGFRPPANGQYRILGISTCHAGQLLVTAGQNIDRPRGDAAFAALCRASPIPASSGRTTRHRLNYGDDRDANRTLHMIAVRRLRYCARTQAYAARRTRKAKPSARSSAA